MSGIAGIPPQSIVDIAVLQASISPCAKSKRGVVIFEPRTLHLAGAGMNHQPEPFNCIGTSECRNACAKLCNHAEQTAIVCALLDDQRPLMGDLELLHVKVRDGKLVADPDDRPSCWQCSRLISHVGLRGVWLYEIRDSQLGWYFYTATEFHRETQINCGLPNTLKG